MTDSALVLPRAKSAVADFATLNPNKREAKKRRVPYQRMIRALVDEYSARHGGKR